MAPQDKNTSTATLPTSDAAHEHVDEDAPGPPISVPDSGEHSEGGKIKMIVQLVKKCLGVGDIAAMRVSLPASLLEPIPNLEFSHYLDRPDFFTHINDSNDPFERMLATLRFVFTKDLKFVHGKVCKPYNSVLGEHFRAHWDVPPLAFEPVSRAPAPRVNTTLENATGTSIAAPSDTSSIRSGKSGKSVRSGLSTFSKSKSTSTSATSVSLLQPNLAAQMSNLSLGAGSTNNGNYQGEERLRVVYVTEQVSHHPPVSAYYASCPQRHIELCGIDQIAAKVSASMTLKVAPGEFNQGIFVHLNGGYGEGETYHITHPTANVNGILRGSFYVTIGETTIITCTGGKPGRKFRTIIEYKEESWLGKAHFLLEGVIHAVDDGDTGYEQWTKVKQVPHSKIVAVFDGTWRGHIRWKRVGMGSYPAATSSSASSPAPSHASLLPSSALTPTMRSAAASRVSLTQNDDYQTLIDISVLRVVPKAVRPLEKQLPHESRRLWKTVTERLLRKEFGEATREKVVIEQKQREIAAERKRQGVEFIPRYFEKDLTNGKAALTPEGRKAVEEELAEDTEYCVEGLGEGQKLEP